MIFYLKMRNLNNVKLWSVSIFRHLKKKYFFIILNKKLIFFTTYDYNHRLKVDNKENNKIY